MEKEQYIGKIREFNRFYTNAINILNQSVLKSDFSLAEARVLYEIRSMESCSARKILEKINIDEGYLSRILNKFVSGGLVIKVQSKSDRRRYYLRLSSDGRKQMAQLDMLMTESIGQWIHHLSAHQLSSLLESMQNVAQLLTLSKK